MTCIVQYCLIWHDWLWEQLSSVALVRIGTGSGPDQTNKLTKPDQPILVGLEDPGRFNDRLLMDRNHLNRLWYPYLAQWMRSMPWLQYSAQDLIMTLTDNEHANSTMSLYSPSPINTHLFAQCTTQHTLQCLKLVQGTLKLLRRL